MEVIASWSGGKDSCLACYKAIKDGYQIRHLLNFISREYKRSYFHGIKAELLRAQADALGFSLVQKEVTADLKKYEEEFKEAVNKLKAKGLKKIVFGDIYLLDHFNWVKRVCSELGVEAIEPLWNIPTDKVLRDFIEAGFKAVVVSAQAKVLGEEFIGRVVDDSLLEDLQKRKICPCGENGEFHTLVVDGPIFKKKIEITKSKPILREGFAKYWFLDIQKYKIV